MNDLSWDYLPQETLSGGEAIFGTYASKLYVNSYVLDIILTVKPVGFGDYTIMSNQWSAEPPYYN